MHSTSTAADTSFGMRLKQWRQRRRSSQLALALDTGISTRHLSFLETGRSRPSREMVLLLAEGLELPLRERNALLASAGFAPLFSQRPLDDPGLAPARAAIDMVLRGHEPNPALAVDRHWQMIAANGAVADLLAGVDASLLQPPVNVLRVSLHPLGLGPRIVNFAAWRHHLLERLKRQVAVSSDPVLGDLLEELRGLPSVGTAAPPSAAGDGGAWVVPLQIASPLGTLSFVSTITVFGTPVDVTLSEIAIESFFPADAATQQALATLARQRAATSHRDG